MRRHVLNRVAVGLLGLLMFLTATFFLARWMIPGDYTSNFAGGRAATSGLRARLGLDLPLWQQWLRWMESVLTFDLGEGANGRPVIDSILAALPWTLAMFVIGIGLAFWVGGKIGRWAGWRRKSLTATTIGAATLTSLFPPWLVFLVLYAGLNVLGFRPFNRLAALQFELWNGDVQPFQIWWKMLGTLAVLAGVVLLAMKLAGNPPRRRMVARVSAIAILPVSLGLWYLMGIGPWAMDLLAFLTFPVTVLFLVVVGDIILVMAAAMDGTAGSDFVTAARAKGLSERQVRDRHAGRVALLPALSRLTAALPFALGGIVIIEASFGALGGYRIPIPGMSSVLFGSLRQRNIVLTLGGLVVVGIITLLVRIGLDIAIAVLDPRVKMEADSHG